MNHVHTLGDSEMNKEDLCLANNTSTHTILTNKKYFSKFTMLEAKVNTISDFENLIKGIGKANTILPKGTKFPIDNALFFSQSMRNLLSFKYIYVAMVIILRLIERMRHKIFILYLLSKMKNIY